MTITLDTFDKIINPGMPLIAAPHTFTAVNDRLSSIEERVDIQRHIDELREKTNEMSGADDWLRQAELGKYQRKLNSYPTLALKPRPSYLIDDEISPAHPSP